MSTKNGKIVTCKQCGTEKYRSGSTLKMAKYCSRGCYFKSQANPPKEVVCKTCSAKFIDNNYQKVRKFCSQKCAKKDWSLNHQGNKSWFWKDEITYASIHIRLRASIQKVSCGFCGNKDNLEYASINHLTKKDKPSINLKDYFVLCSKCHRNYDKPYRSYKK